MTKAQFLSHVRALYIAANTADSDNKAGDWMRIEMVGNAGCAALDKMLRAMEDCYALTPEEVQSFYDNM
jgi:hypothetical protein